MNCIAIHHLVNNREIQHVNKSLWVYIDRKFRSCHFNTITIFNCLPIEICNSIFKIFKNIGIATLKKLSCKFLAFCPVRNSYYHATWIFLSLKNLLRSLRGHTNLSNELWTTLECLLNKTDTHPEIKPLHLFQFTFDY